MNRDNVQRWVDELMFGDHPQTYGTLHNRYIRTTMPKLQEYAKVTETIPEPELETYVAHCALGVADLIRPAFFGADYMGPITDVVVQWLGLTEDQCNEIVELNDTKQKSLPEIGVWVRDNWLKEE